jgi:hypothetical protein
MNPGQGKRADSKLVKLQAQCDAWNVAHPVGTTVADSSVLVVINLGPGYTTEPFVDIAFFDADKKAFQDDESTVWLDGVTPPISMT